MPAFPLAKAKEPRLLAIKPLGLKPSTWINSEALTTTLPVFPLPKEAEPITLPLSSWIFVAFTLISPEFPWLKLRVLMPPGNNELMLNEL